MDRVQWGGPHLLPPLHMVKNGLEIMQNYLEALPHLHSPKTGAKFEALRPSDASPGSFHILPSPVFIKKEHPCLHHCWQTSTGWWKSSPNVPPEKLHPLMMRSSVCAELHWTGSWLHTDESGSALSTPGTSTTLWSGLPPIQASPVRERMCEEEQEIGEGRGGETVRER